MSTSLPGPRGLLWGVRPPRLAPGLLASACEPCVERRRGQASPSTRGVARPLSVDWDPGAAGSRQLWGAPCGGRPLSCSEPQEHSGRCLPQFLEKQPRHKEPHVLPQLFPVRGGPSVMASTWGQWGLGDGAAAGKLCRVRPLATGRHAGVARSLPGTWDQTPARSVGGLNATPSPTGAPATRSRTEQEAAAASGPPWAGVGRPV